MDTVKNCRDVELKERVATACFAKLKIGIADYREVATSGDKRRPRARQASAHPIRNVHDGSLIQKRRVFAAADGVSD
ncbi:hypothetical protein [Burkholderia metallica]|uniref:hypothetical protein n=1 Tax=Burkholderia metallica TaxID=488729 RepID=UPI0015897629|nr:hypothetical protein [Burkholderia metallica]